MKKNKRGMTLITLGVTLVVIIIIISTVVVSGLSSLESAKKTSFGIEIKAVQDAADDYRLRTGELVPTTKTVNLSTALISEEIRTAQFSGETITSDALRLEVIDLPEIGIKDTKYGVGDNELDYYAISTTTNKVYYLAGVKAGGKVFYTLTSDLNKIISKNSNAATTNKSILFKSNVAINKWTNSAFTIIIKVPEAFTVNSITASDSVLVSEVTVEDGYKVYNVNTSNLVKNYTVTVSYNVPGNITSKTAIYKVEKVDNVSPLIATPTQVYNIDSTTEIATAYIVGIIATDVSSQVKSLKYVKGTITTDVDLEDFFNEYGINVEDNMIQIEKGATSYSIYAEDNAGNHTVINVTITEYIKGIL